MADIRHEEKVKLTISDPLITIGRHDGGHFNAQKNQTEYYGEVEVSPQIAEDLRRRQAAWDEHQRNLHRNNGRSDVNAGDIVGGSN